MKIAAFFCLLFATNAQATVNATDPAWRALLHFSGSRSSVAEHSPFFLSPEGFRDPQAELKATLAYFQDHPDSAACRFPARAIYLGSVNEGNGELCGRWQRWREAISATGAELVFAAAYINSPSSMYGHTLLKFVRPKKEDLLDYTLSYGAKTGSSVGLPYVWLGLTGGFDGSYTTAPFYLKVQEYNFVENRDFWIYPLKLDANQLRLLVAHSWELREVDFPYFFLHRNCSYYLLELLEVLRPGSRLTNSFPFWAVPLDTIRRLKSDDWLGTPRYRRSRYRRLRARSEGLRPGEARMVQELAENGEAGVLPPGREAILLDAAYELWRYRSEGKNTGQMVEQKLLAARSLNIGAAANATNNEVLQPPDLGHSTSRAGVGYGMNRANAFAEFTYRGTLHDLLADPEGYEEYSELSMGDIRARVEEHKIFLERFDLLRLRSLAPRERWIPRWAWSFRGGLSRAKEFSCADWQCLRGGIDGGWGAAVLFGPVLGFALLEAEVEAGKPFDRGYRIGVGPAGGFFSPLWRGGRLLLEGEWRLHLMGTSFEKRGVSLGFSQSLGTNWETRGQFEIARAYREGQWQLLFYF